MTHFAGPEDIIVAAIARYRDHADHVRGPFDDDVLLTEEPAAIDILRGRTGDQAVRDELADPVRNTLRLLVRDQAWQTFSCGGDFALYAMIGRIEERLPDRWHLDVLGLWLEGVGCRAA